MMAKLVMELIGTFFLVATVGSTVLGRGTGVLPPLAIGAALMVMVYAGGHVSGGHYNPAVSLGAWLRGRLPSKDLAPYWVAQIVGAVLAALAVGFLRPDAVIEAMAPDVPRALLAEVLFSFALVLVVLSSATAKATSGNSFYGLAIGFTVMAGAFAVGDISGAAFNPAVAVGASVLGLFAWSNLWIYVVADLLGGAAAAMVFKMMHPGDV
jgi:aquaporin Z